MDLLTQTSRTDLNADDLGSATVNGISSKHSSKPGGKSIGKHGSVVWAGRLNGVFGPKTVLAVLAEDGKLLTFDI